LPDDHLPALCAFVCRAFTVCSSSREVMLLSVFTHRATRGITWCQLSHALPHPRHPGGRNTMLVAGIELRDHLALEQVVERFRFGSVPSEIVAMLLAVAQRPPDFRRVCFRPPAI